VGVETRVADLARADVTEGTQMRSSRRRIAVLGAAVLSLAQAVPTLAAEPQVTSVDEPVPDVIRPAGAAACDVAFSTLDGELEDGDFSAFRVRAYEDFVVWGFEYPSNTAITIAFEEQASGDVEAWETLSDGDGFFAEVFAFYPEASGTTWFVDATDAAATCTDGGVVTVLPPHPFTDVTRFEPEISWLHRAGITGGCSATRFCPTAAVTRGQMAAFLNRALGLEPTATDFFDDDDGTAFEGDINRLAAAGITGGCAARRFCQDATVTREQMASFLTRALKLPATAIDRFTDDENSIHEGDINRLAAAGITGGCTATTFCPRSVVTREQMAAFLYRSLYE
jgi:S-layer homology domain